MRRTPSTTSDEELENILKALQTLCRGVDNLRRDVNNLAGRIQPFGDEKLPSSVELLDYVLQNRAVSLKNILEIVAQSDRRLRNMELDVTAIRNYIDQISNDTVSRAELKRWIDVDKERSKRR